jgi:hypothetical protein
MVSPAQAEPALATQATMAQAAVQNLITHSPTQPA